MFMLRPTHEMVHFIHLVKEEIHTVLAYPVREIGRNWVFLALLSVLTQLGILLSYFTQI